MAKPIAKPRTPIWTRPPPGARQPKLTRDQIAATALAIADVEGLEEVSMRRIATELGVGTMTLYYYVKTKDDLVTLMNDAIIAKALLPDDQLAGGWRAGLTALARVSRDVFRRHPWALYKLQGAGIGPSSMRHIEQSLAVIADAPLDTRGKLHLLSIVDDFVIGHVLRNSEGDSHPLDLKVLQVIADFFESQLDTGKFPHIEALVDDQDMLTAFTQFAAWMSDDARFEIGLTALLDGMELRMMAGLALLAAPEGRQAARKHQPARAERGDRAEHPRRPRPRPATRRPSRR